MKKIVFSIILSISLFFPNLSISLDTEQTKKAKDSVEKGLNWLKKEQNKDGSWTQVPMPAVTGLIVRAFLQAGYSEKDEVVKKGIEFILKHVKEDGGIYDKAVPSQNTGVCVVALHLTKNPKYEKIVKKAQDYLKGIQVGETKGITHSDKTYGGIGYGSKGTPDLQNLVWAIEGLRETSETSIERPTGDADAPNVWDRAILFLTRCQNRKASNDQEWTSDDGGFIYSSVPESKAGGTKSYGSMTYAGLLSFIYCQVDKKDPKVQAAYNWIKSNYTLEENPGMEAQGLFYSYHTFAKALTLYGEDNITDKKEISHDWKKELIEKITSLQSKEGYWINEKSNRWMEDSKELVTSYAILALQRCIE